MGWHFCPCARQLGTEGKRYCPCTRQHGAKVVYLCLNMSAQRSSVSTPMHISTGPSSGKEGSDLILAGLVRGRAEQGRRERCSAMQGSECGSVQGRADQGRTGWCIAV